jgi:nucleotide-binding universal stress UspA family protein
MKAEPAVNSRIQLKNVLYATDFSAAANAATPYVRELVKYYRAKLYAFHVRPSAVNPMTPPETWASMKEAAAVEAEQEREKLIQEFAPSKPEVLIREGDLWSNLRAAIQENDIDLIVLGTRGRSGIRKFLLGSVAEEIFRNAPCPVLTVGPYSLTEAKPVGEISRILYATDFSPESTAAAPYAVSLAQEFQAYLTLLHVIREPKPGELVHPSDLAASSERLLRQIVPKDAELWCVPDYIVEQGPAADKILDVAAGKRAELIILGVRQPTGLGGAATHLPFAIAHKVVSQANCPVLTVRAKRQ